ncbi:hypothetical protein QFZ71_001655 [Streptomyces sp. V2I9]|nr:hypothetical protein [Streptomyces sp. V2I9]
MAGEPATDADGEAATAGAPEPAGKATGEADGDVATVGGGEVNTAVDDAADGGTAVIGAPGADAREVRRAMPHDVRHIRPTLLSGTDFCGQPGSCGYLGPSAG